MSLKGLRSRLTTAFLDGTLAPEAFGHREHVQVAFELLGADDFLTVASTYLRGIRTLAGRAGAPDKVHVTATLAWLSVIAERRSANAEDDFEAFIRTHADLLDVRLLTRWYTQPRLASKRARDQFVMPDRTT